MEMVIVIDTGNCCRNLSNQRSAQAILFLMVLKISYVIMREAMQNLISFRRKGEFKNMGNTDSLNFHNKSNQVRKFGLLNYDVWVKNNLEAGRQYFIYIKNCS
jgi:hypothetical protein